MPSFLPGITPWIPDKQYGCSVKGIDLCNIIGRKGILVYTFHSV